MKTHLLLVTALIMGLVKAQSIQPSSSNPSVVCGSGFATLSYELVSPPVGARNYAWTLTVQPNGPYCGGYMGGSATGNPATFSNVALGTGGNWQLSVSVIVSDINNSPLGTYNWSGTLSSDDGALVTLTCSNCNSLGELPYTAGQINLTMSPAAHPSRGYVLEENIGGNWTPVSGWNCGNACNPSGCSHTITYTPSPSLIGQQRIFRIQPSSTTCSPSSQSIAVRFVDVSSALPNGLREYTLFPNPNRGQVEVVLPTHGEYVWRLLDLTGRVVDSGEFVGQRQELVLSVPRGTYYIEVLQGRHSVMRSLMMVE